MLYISGARLVADKQVRIASTKICGIELKKAIQVRYRLGRNGFPSRVLLGILRSFMNIFFFLFSLIMLFILHFLFILEFLVNGLSLLFRKLFHSIFDRLNSIMFNCCISETFLFCIQIGFCLFGFLLFSLDFFLMFPEMEKGELPNPPQVIAQLCSFFYLFK